ncbi:MAG: hypothetical protein ACTSO3_01065 [Candidatus Heimdallarchaeaceae archaeon]
MTPIKNPEILKRQEFQLQWIQGLLVSAQKRRWYGKITMEIKNGMVHEVTNIETLRPPEPE